MTLITSAQPATWQDLEEVVAAILEECGMTVLRQASLTLPRGSVDVDVLAHDTIDGIRHTIICECKNWAAAIPKAVVHSFRTVILETGAHRGYIISKAGFQSGAKEAAQATNIDLATFEEFQHAYFAKWIRKRIWSLEEAIGNINTYYEPLGRPGYSQLNDERERAAYDAVYNKYLFCGLMLVPFSPYIRMVNDTPYPVLPFDVSKMEEHGIQLPTDIRSATGYRELLSLLEGYASVGLKELRAVNPITRGKASEEIERED